MTLFVDAYCDKEGITLHVNGERLGDLHGGDVEEVCLQLTTMIPMDGSVEVFVDCSGYGIAVADFLSRYVKVIAISPKPLQKIPVERNYELRA